MSEQGMESVAQIPDPTDRTLQSLKREVEFSRESALKDKEIVETRLGAMDKAIALLQANADRSPTVAVVHESVKHLQELTDEKFDSIAKQFSERDTRTEQTSRDSKVAVDAALQAAKEAVGEQNKSNALAIAKSEAAFTKQIDQIGVLFQTTVKGTDDKIDDIKTRLTLIEGQKKGTETSQAMVFAVGTLIVIIGMLAVAIIGLYLRTQ